MPGGFYSYLSFLGRLGEWQAGQHSRNTVWGVQVLGSGVLLYQLLLGRDDGVYKRNLSGSCVFQEKVCIILKLRSRLDYGSPAQANQPRETKTGDRLWFLVFFPLSRLATPQSRSWNGHFTDAGEGEEVHTLCSPIGPRLRRFSST